jgi:hypothetical protein
MKALLVSGRAFVIPKIRSKTLRRYLRQYQAVHGRRGYLNVPQFWAWYYHDGRGPASSPSGKYLVWFRNPKKDPRLAGGYPFTRREAQARQFGKKNRMPSERFARLVKAGEIIVRKRSRSVPSGRANPFFTTGMRGFKGEANNVMRRNLPILLTAEMKRRGIIGRKIKVTL